MNGFCLHGQTGVFKDKWRSLKGYLPLAMAQEIQVKVLSFQTNARIKEGKKRSKGFVLKVGGLDLVPRVGAVCLDVGCFSLSM